MGGGVECSPEETPSFSWLWGSHHLSWMEEDFWWELHPPAGSSGGTLVALHFGLSLGLLQGRVDICLHIYRGKVPI